MDYILVKEMHGILGILFVGLFLSLSISIIILYFSNKNFNKIKKLSKYILMLFHFQILMGIAMWFVSPRSGLNTIKNISGWIKKDELRFYTLEHPFMMIIIAVLITILNKSIQKDKGTKSIIYISIIFIIIFLAFPFNRFF